MTMMMQKKLITSAQLDHQFTISLSAISHSVGGLQRSQDASSCYMWIEKLSSYPDRKIRNVYMSQLEIQLQKGVLYFPFNGPPCAGVLPPMDASQGSGSSESEASHIESCYPSSAPNETSQVSEDQTELSNEHHWEDVWRKLCLEFRNKFCEFCRKKEFETQRLREAYDQKIDQLQKTTAQLTDILNQLTSDSSIANLAMNGKSTNDMSALRYQWSRSDISARTNLTTLAEEVMNLKTKLIELQTIKVNLEMAHHEIVSQYQQEMAASLKDLSQKLEDSHQKNLELEEYVATLNKRINDANVANSNNLQNLEHAYEDKLKSEVLKYHEELNALESSHEEKVQDLQSQILDLQAKLEEKSVQIIIAEKMVSKIGKMKDKQAKEYEILVNQIQRDKAIELKEMQLKMQAQRTQLAMTLSHKKQEEVEQLIINLEKKYKDMIVNVEKNAWIQHQKDLKTIFDLEAKLKSSTGNP